MADAVKAPWRSWLVPLAAALVGVAATLMLWRYAATTLESFNHSQATLIHQTAHRDLEAALQRQETIARTLSQALAESDASRSALAAVAHSLLQQYPELVAIDRYVAAPPAEGPGAWRQVQRVTRAGALANPDLRPWAVPHWRAVIDDAWYQMQPGVTPLASGDAFAGDNLLDKPTVNLFWPVADTGPTGFWQVPPRLFSDPPRQLLGIVIAPSGLLSPLTTAVPGRPGPTVSYALFDLNSQARDPIATTADQRFAAATAKKGLSYEDDLAIAGRRWRLRTTFDTTLPSSWRAYLQLLLVAGFGLTLLATLAAYKLEFGSRHLNDSRLKTLHHLERKRRALQNAAIEKDTLGRALRDSDQRTRDFVSLGESFCAELDEQGRIGFISPQIASMVDLEPATLNNHLFTDLLSEDEKPRFQALILNKAGPDKARHLETALLQADGGHTPVTLALKPVTDPLGHCQGFRLVGRRRS